MITQEVTAQIAKFLREQRGFVTKRQLDKAVLDGKLRRLRMGQLEDVVRQLVEVPPARSTAPGDVRRVALVPEMRSVDSAGRTITFVCSDETVDRYGDRLISSGFRTENYMKAGGPVLWSHRADQPPVGKTTSIHVENAPPALVNTVQFANKDTSEFGDQIFRLYAGGFLRGVSVGFRPLQPPEPMVDDKGNPTGGYIFREMDLIEISCTSCPANPNAVARAISSGIVSETDARRIFAVEEKVELELQSLKLNLLAIEVDTLQRKVELLRSRYVTPASPERHRQSVKIETIEDFEKLWREGK